MNGLISKVVEICATNNIPYLVYSTWRRGDHGEFQASNGFIRTPLPENLYDDEGRHGSSPELTSGTQRQDTGRNDDSTVGICVPSGMPAKFGQILSGVHERDRVECEAPIFMSVPMEQAARCGIT